MYGIEDDVDKNPFFWKDMTQELNLELLAESQALEKQKVEFGILDDDELELKFLREEGCCCEDLLE